MRPWASSQAAAHSGGGVDGHVFAPDGEGVSPWQQREGWHWRGGGEDQMLGHTVMGLPWNENGFDNLSSWHSAAVKGSSPQDYHVVWDVPLQ